MHGNSICATPPDPLSPKLQADTLYDCACRIYKTTVVCIAIVLQSYAVACGRAERLEYLQVCELLEEAGRCDRWVLHSSSLLKLTATRMRHKKSPSLSISPACTGPRPSRSHYLYYVARFLHYAALGRSTYHPAWQRVGFFTECGKVIPEFNLTTPSPSSQLSSEVFL